MYLSVIHLIDLKSPHNLFYVDWKNEYDKWAKYVRFSLLTFKLKYQEMIFELLCMTSWTFEGLSA